MSTRTATVSLTTRVALRPRPVVDDWLLRPVPRASGARQVVCFPHAGGDVSAFAELAEALPAELEVAAVRLPGRGGRFREKMPTLFGDLVAGVVAGVSPRIRPGAMFYGQSFGALLAYEVARALPANLRPALLVPACAPAPGDWPGRVPDPEAEAMDLFQACGLSDQLPADSDLFDMALGVLRGDLAVCHGYRHRPAPGFDVPVHAVAGADDPVVGRAQAQRWAALTEGPFAATVVPGGHLLATTVSAGPADLLAALALRLPALTSASSAAQSSPAPTSFPEPTRQQGARP